MVLHYCAAFFHVFYLKHKIAACNCDYSKINSAGLPVVFKMETQKTYNARLTRNDWIKKTKEILYIYIYTFNALTDVFTAFTYANPFMDALQQL